MLGAVNGGGLVPGYADWFGNGNAKDVTRRTESEWPHSNKEESIKVLHEVWRIQAKELIPT